MGLADPLKDNWYHKFLLIGIKQVKQVKQVKGNIVQHKLPVTLDILKGIHNTLNIYCSSDDSFRLSASLVFSACSGSPTFFG